MDSESMTRLTTQRRRRRVSASDLATLGRCERQAMYRSHRYPEQADPQMDAARERGEAEHARRHQVVTAPTMTGGVRREPCFIASAVYGDVAWQTKLLRSWRDRVLLPHWWGKVLVSVYYRLSPPVVTAIRTWPRLQQFTRTVLNRFIRLLERREK